MAKHPQSLLATVLFCMISMLSAAQQTPVALIALIKKSCESEVKKDYTPALSYADEAIKDFPTSIYAIDQRADVLYEMGNERDALAEFKRAASLCNECSTPYLALARIKDKHGLHKEAYSDVGDLINKTSSKVMAAYLYYERGEMKMHQAVYDEAYIDYCKAYDLKPESMFYLSRMILHEIHLPNDSTLVKKHLAKFKIDKNDDKASFLYINRGFIYSLMKRYKEALDDYDLAYTLNPKAISSLISGAIMKLYLNRPDEAKKDMEQALLLFPNSAGVWNNSGFIKLYQNKYDEAMIDLEKSLQIDSTANPDAYNNRGYIYYKKGGTENYKKALEDYDKSIAVGSKIYNPHWKYRDSVVAALGK